MTDAPVVAALRDPRAYPHPCSSIRLIETHISWVFLTGDYAYKLKKPLDFGFLDFTTLARREFFCREEIRCNARFAPELYLDCVPVTREADGAIRVGGTGEVVEYAVKMRQFDGRDQLDLVLARGELDVSMLRRFALELAGIYRDLPAVGGGVDRFGEAQVAAPVYDNLAELARRCTHRHEQDLLDALGAWSRRRHEQLKSVFDDRAREGVTRECHGDLHLANLIWRDDRIRAFDCIEFNESLRLIDPVNDIAFLFMDLAVRGRTDLAYGFVDAYFDVTGDYTGAACLRYYAVYRSLVRAKIARLRLDQAADDDTARRLSEHLGWAAIATRPRRALVVLTCGVSGSGKSWLAERLAPLLPALRIRSDVARRADPGESADTAADATRYSAARREAVYTQLLGHARRIAEGGEHVIVDATFTSRAARREFADMSAAIGCDCVVVYCNAARDCLERRIERRRRAADDPSEATVDVLHEQLRHFEAPGPAECVVDVATDEAFDVAAVAARIEAARQPA